MKVSWLGLSLLSLLAVPTVAAPSESETKVGNRLEKRRNNRGVDAEEPSIFNGLDVPPLLQLTPDNYEELTKDGTWSVPSAPKTI
jgi:protein disulfide-isomerase